MSEITLPQNKKPHSSDRYVSWVNFRLISWMWWVMENKLWVVIPITLKFLKRFLSLIGDVKRSSRSSCGGKRQNKRESKIKKNKKQRLMTRSGREDATTCAKRYDYSSSQTPQVRYNIEITRSGGAMLQDLAVMKHYSLYKYIWVNKH